MSANLPPCPAPPSWQVNWDALQEHVTVREQGNQQPVEEVRLADDDSPHLFPQRPDPI